MRFSKRIIALRDSVEIGESVADIGTDHGYVPMLLVRDKISPNVIMSDISEGSLSKAIETFKIVNIPTSNNQFRVGDGLSTINNSEVDDIIIAGLGGHTISEILGKDIIKTKSFKKLILQPRKHSGNLRMWLYKNGFDIVCENLTAEGKFICEIITAVPTNETYRDLPYSENDIRWAYPNSLRLCNQEYLRKRVSWKLDSIVQQINNLKNSDKDQKDQIDSLELDYKYLSKLINI